MNTQNLLKILKDTMDGDDICKECYYTISHYVEKEKLEQPELNDLKESLKQISKVARGSRNQTKRILWVAARAESAINGDEKYKEFQYPKTANEKSLLHKQQQINRFIKQNNELISVVKDCLSYADALAVLKQGEAVELRDKCRSVIKKAEGFNNGST